MSFTGEGTVVSNVNEAYCFAAWCNPFEIFKAELSSSDSEKKAVYAIAMRGTDSSWDKENPLSIPVCLLAACARDNSYLRLMKKMISEYIPKGSDLVFIGHSLGGMISQQLGADEEIRNSYKILNILSIGSPYVVFAGKKCPLRRMATVSDVIPNAFGLLGFFNYFAGDVIHEDTGYFFNPLGAHCDSYEKEDAWKKYDCFGIENGGHSLEITEIIYKK